MLGPIWDCLQPLFALKYVSSENDNSLVAETIAEKLYVDNGTLGAKSVDEAYHLFRESRNIFKRASMNLREWVSNLQGFLNQLPDDQRVVGCVVKLFGMLWNRNEDYIQVADVNMPLPNMIVTKREVLCFVAKIYDPLGPITPEKNATITLPRVLEVTENVATSLNLT